MVDLIEPLAGGIVWTFDHWFAIMVAAGAASFVVMWANVIRWWRTGGPWE